MFKKWIDKIKKKKGDEEFTGHMVDPGGGPSRRMSVPVTSSKKGGFFNRGNQKEEVKQQEERLKSTHKPIMELEEEEQMALPADFA